MNYEKIQALADFLGISVNEIEIGNSYSEATTEYLTPDGTYTVMTEEEAYDATVEEIEDFLDDYGIDGFSEHGQDYILSNCADTDWFYEAYQEMNDSYAEDIQNEEDEEYGNRLNQECIENGLINEDDIVDGEYVGNEDLAELLAEYLTDSIDDYAEQFKFDFGDEEFKDAVRENCKLDIEAIADFIIREDGYGNSLASWDGVTNEEGDFYIFKQDDYDNRSQEFIDNVKPNLSGNDIRNNFEYALSVVDNGSDLSKILEWHLSKEDISNLAKLHKANIYRDKIEDLLTDCNFHYECSQFSKGNYNEFLY